MSLARRVLMVEDEAALREVLAEYLRAEGFDVDLAVNGVEALRMARQSTPDVLILDVNMPVLDGVAVLETWTADADLGAVPVVLVSATPSLSRLATQFGVRASLAKPFDLDVLVAVIEQALAHPEAPPNAPTVGPENSLT